MSVISSQVVSGNAIETKGSQEKKILQEVDFLENSDNFVLLDIPSGRPNHKAESPKRIPQNKQKGDLCVYYGLQLHAQSLPNYLEAREKQTRKYAMEYRRAMTKHFVARQISLIFFEYIDQKKLMTLFQQGNDTVKTQIIDKCLALSLEKTVTPFLKDIKNGHELIMQTYNEFSAQNLEWNQFLLTRYQKAIIGECLTFIRLLGLDPAKECEKLTEYQSNTVLNRTAKVYSNILDNEQVPLLHKCAHLMTIVKMKLFKIFDLNPSTWIPTNDKNNIDTLCNELRKSKKPLIIHGAFGRDQYMGDAVKTLGNLHHYELYGFKSQQRKVLTGDTAHIVAVIGIKKDPKIAGGGLVYTLDPEDASYPDKPRKTSVMNFQSLLRYIMDDSGHPNVATLQMKDSGEIVRLVAKIPSMKHYTFS